MVTCLRDGPGVLPTGRNIHALDPYRMPSPAAYARGKAIGRNIIAQHLEEKGTYPETVAVMLWGLDAIKTRGESLGILLELVGGRAGEGRYRAYRAVRTAAFRANGPSPHRRAGQPVGHLSG